MIVSNCSSKCGQHLRFVSLNMIRLNVRALSYVNVIFRILLRFWYFLWLEDDFDLSSFTYDPLRYFCYPIDTKSGQALAFVEDTKIQNKTKNYIFVKIFFLILIRGIFFLAYAYVRILYLLFLKQLGPNLRFIYIHQSWIHVNRLSLFATVSFYYFRKPFCRLNSSHSCLGLFI